MTPSLLIQLALTLQAAAGEYQASAGIAEAYPPESPEHVAASESIAAAEAAASDALVAFLDSLA